MFFVFCGAFAYSLVTAFSFGCRSGMRYGLEMNLRSVMWEKAGGSMGIFATGGGTMMGRGVRSGLRMKLRSAKHAKICLCVGYLRA